MLLRSISPFSNKYLSILAELNQGENINKITFSWIYRIEIFLENNLPSLET